MTILDRHQLTTVLREAFPYAAISAPFDLQYALVAHDHIADVFGGELSTQLFVLQQGRLGRTGWAVAFDCDKFARFSAAFISLKHALAQGLATDVPEGVTFGILCYSRGGQAGQGHCINVMVTEHGVETWEPQTQQFVLLSAEEQRSAWLVQF